MSKPELIDRPIGEAPYPLIIKPERVFDKILQAEVIGFNKGRTAQRDRTYQDMLDRLPKPREITKRLWSMLPKNRDYKLSELDYVSIADKLYQYLRARMEGE